MNAAFQLPCWPLGPFLGWQTFLGLLVVVGAIFSLIMLIDCLKRRPEQFLSPLTKNGDYDKLIWALAIVMSFWFYFLGAIIYLFVVKAAGDKKQQQ